MRTRFLLVTLLTFLHVTASAQFWDAYKGELKTAGPCTVKNFNTRGVFDIINQQPFFNQPRGMNVEERIRKVWQHLKVYSGLLYISLVGYYNRNGKAERQGEYSSLEIYLNDRDVLWNTNHTILPDETPKLGFSTIITDTLAVRYKEINGYTVGISEDPGLRPLYILNPKRQALFVPVTIDQYTRFWISYLAKLSAEAQKDLSNLRENHNGYFPEQLKSELHRYDSTIKGLEKEKQQFEKKLTAMSAVEKNEQAYYRMGRDIRLYEPCTKSDPNKVVPLYTYNPAFFDSRLPQTAIQLMVIRDPTQSTPYTQYDKDFKRQLDTKVFPFIEYGKLAGLMYN